LRCGIRIGFRFSAKPQRKNRQVIRPTANVVERAAVTGGMGEGKQKAGKKSLRVEAA
jgi:hypothetical protein